MAIKLNDSADFYIGRGDTAQWLGSVSDYGHPQDFILDTLWVLDEDHTRYTPEDFRNAVRAHMRFTDKEGAPVHGDGWPWAYGTSKDTGWSYFYDNGTVYVYRFGVEMLQVRCNYWKDQLDEHQAGKPRAHRPVTSAFPEMGGSRA